MHSGSTPEASGSRVPPWPMAVPLGRRLRTNTTRFELVMPVGLFAIRNPFMRSFLFL